MQVTERRAPLFGRTVDPTEVPLVVNARFLGVKTSEMTSARGKADDALLG